MTFLAPLALAVLLTLAGPVIAHALRQGHSRAFVFPATRFVDPRQASTKERRRLKDQMLMVIRLLSLACLALLGATPFVSCSRLSLARDHGASMAVVLVIDDSGSMQVEDDGRSRLEQALKGARELLLGTRSGDAVGIVLAGRPARLALAPTTDLGRAQDVLEEITASDRPTELELAVTLAHDALTPLPQADKQVVLLSDRATTGALPQSAIDVWTPLPELARSFENCAVVRARQEPGQVSAEIACTAGGAGPERLVELISQTGTVIATAKLAEMVQLPLGDQTSTDGLSVRLTGARSPAKDQLPADDRIDVEPKAASFVVGLCADAARSGLPTSGTTVLHAALSALDRDLTIDPITVLPDHPAALESMAALLIDDPPGLTPEAASVIEGFVKRGGVVLALLGRQVAAAPLGATFDPLVVGAPTWSSADVRGAGPASTGTFGNLAQGWSDMPSHGRVVVPEQPPETSVLLRFADGQPLVLQRPIEHGLLVTTLLPSSVELSDFALRPAFLALVDRVLEEARLRGSSAATEVGQQWEVPDGTLVQGPTGRLDPITVDGRSLVVPDRVGRYTLRAQARESSRFALRSAQEATLQPNGQATQRATQSSRQAPQMTDISREIALALLGLMLLEFGVRAYKGLRPNGANRARYAPAASPRADRGPLL